MGKTLGMLLLAVFVAFMGKALFRVYWKYEATHGGDVSAPVTLANKTTIEKDVFKNIKKTCIDEETCEVAASKLESFCENGEAYACYELYWLYWATYNKDKEIISADKACSGGIAEACSALGWTYYSSFSRHETDMKKSTEYYDKACNLGDSASCSFVAEYYEDGKFYRVDYFKAREYYERACNGGYAKACNRLGYLYENGNGIRIDFKKAMEYYGKACDLEEQRGCEMYKELYLKTQ